MMQLIFLLLTLPPCYQKDMTQVGFTVLRRKKLILDQVQRQVFFFLFSFFYTNLVWGPFHVNGQWLMGMRPIPLRGSLRQLGHGPTPI